MAYLRMRISGRSMMPLLRDGQRVLVLAGCTVADIRRGDVVGVRDGRTGLPLLHRVLRVEGDAFHTLGDGNVNPEGPWRGGDLMGRLAAVEREGSWREPRAWVNAFATATMGAPVGVRRRLNRLVAPFFAGRRLDVGAEARDESPVMAAAGMPLPPLPDWIEAQELGGELFIHDRRSGDVTILNATARAVWTLARGGFDGAQIHGMLVERFPDEDPARLRADVDSVLASTAKLLSAADGSEPPAARDARTGDR